MEHQLDPTHSEVRKKAIERIREHIARVVFGAAEKLEITDVLGQTEKEEEK